jgi:hypothetical protein
MELASERFRETVGALFNRPLSIVATVHLARHLVTDALKRCRGLDTLRLTERPGSTPRRARGAAPRRSSPTSPPPPPAAQALAGPSPPWASNSLPSRIRAAISFDSSR